MKITLKALTSVLAIATLIIFTGCGGGSDPEPSVEDQQLAKLTSTWNLTEVTLDTPTNSKKSDYPSFTLTLTGTAGATSFGYSTSGRPATSPWKASGTWAFGSSPESQITRDKGTADELPLTYSLSADGKTLQVSFTFTGTGYTNARTSNVKGAWIFTFTKP